MAERYYEVTLHAPIGKRTGELTLQDEAGTVRGELRILRQSTELTGTIDADHCLEVSGELVTAVRRIPYTAEGRISENNIQMTMHAGHSSYELTGVNKKEKAVEKG